MRLLPALLILSCLAAEPVELTPAQRAEFAAEQLATVQGFGRGLPREPVRKLRDVLDFTIEKGRLVPVTPLKNDVFAAQPLSDDVGKCVVQRYPIQLDIPVADGDSPVFTFEIKRFDPRTLEVESVRVARIFNQVNFDLTIVGLSQTRTIQLSDPGPSGRDKNINLYEETMASDSQALGPDDAHVAGSKSHFAAANLSEMIRDHRNEVLPLVRQLFGSIRRPDVVARLMENVWIRAARPWLKLPDELVKQVNALVKQLDADEYSDRQKAFDALSALGDTARLAMLTIDPSTLSDEQRSSLAALLEEVGEVDADELQRVSSRGVELVDGLYATNPIVREAICERIEELTGITLELDTNAEPSVEVVEAIRAKIQKLDPP